MSGFTLQYGRDANRLQSIFGNDDGGGSDDFDGLRLMGWASKGSRPAAPSGGVEGSASTASSGPSASLIGASVAGALAGAYSNFHAVQMRQIETRQQADMMGHRARLMDLDYRDAFQQAQNELEAGQSQIAATRLVGAQRRAELEASAAARGVEVSGSTAEAQASERLIEDINVYHINLASVQANNASRRRAVAIENEQRFARVSQRNLRRTAKYAQPEAALIGGLFSAASTGAGLGS
jgi:hypothetical protein